MRQSYLCVKQITKKEQIAHLSHLFSRTLIPRTKPVPDLQKSNRSLPSRLPLDIHNSHPLPHAHPIANSHPIHNILISHLYQLNLSQCLRPPTTSSAIPKSPPPTKTSVPTNPQRHGWSSNTFLALLMR